MAKKSSKADLTQTEVSLYRFEELSQKRISRELDKDQENLIPVLRIIDGQNRGEHYILANDETIIGRDEECALTFKDPKLSRQHCKITIEEKSSIRSDYHASIEDLKSRNGTFVNKKKIKQKHHLVNGDKIKIGSNTFGLYLKFPEELELENYLYKLATKDSTTGLLTKAFFDSCLEFELKRSLRYKRPLSFVIMDIDHFKKVNDTYGHPVGDLVLSEVGKILTAELRFEDTAIRYGGEEFAIILPETTEEASFTVVERIRKIIEEHPFKTPEGEQFKVTASFGISEVGGSISTAKSLVGKADQALYKAKQTGRNRLCFASKLAS